MFTDNIYGYILNDVISSTAHHSVKVDTPVTREGCVKLEYKGDFFFQLRNYGLFRFVYEILESFIPYIWPRLFVIGFSQRRFGFGPRSIIVGYLVERVTMGQFIQ